MKEINYEEKIIYRAMYCLRFLYRDSHDALGETEVSIPSPNPLQKGIKKWVSVR